jgi:hypothetical protein
VSDDLKCVYKYTIGEPAITGVIAIDIPGNAKILSAHNQREQLHIWALVDPNAVFRQRIFHYFGTGIKFKNHDLLQFIGTVMFDNGNFVVHVFEELDMSNVKAVHENHSVYWKDKESE